MREAFTALSSALFLMAVGPLAASAGGLPTDHLVTTWTALPSTHLVPLDGTPSPIKLRKAHATGAEPAADVLESAFASATDGRTRGDLALYETATSWPQNQRTALFDARDAQRRFVAAATRVERVQDDATHDDRFAALVTQVADGTGRSSAVDERVIDGEMANALRGARARVDAPRRAEVEASQTAWLAYRDAMLAFADVKAPGLTATIRGEVTARRAHELDAIGR